MAPQLLDRAAELVDIPSVSHDETAIADHLERLLRDVAGLRVERAGDNVVARTELGRPWRLLLAGHIDTVPPSGNERARIEGDVLYGLGSVDMKSGVAVLVELARTVSDLAVDATYFFYACEEVGARHSGLRVLFAEVPSLVEADAVILAEPTAGGVEAGCQGTMRVELTMAGRRAHAARAWLGRNAIHRLGGVLRRLEAYEPRRPVLDGCEFHEGLQAVRVEGGVAGNVVPDRAVLVVNHRFAPDRGPTEAEAHVREVVGDVDGFRVLDVAQGAKPGLDHPLLAALLTRGGFSPRAKLGWTDVARFAALGVPALNFGPGDPLLAHMPEEHVERQQLETTFSALRELLTLGPA